MPVALKNAFSFVFVFLLHEYNLFFWMIYENANNVQTNST